MTGITADKLNAALGLIDRFENGEQPLALQDAEQLVRRIFDACGYEVTQSGFVGGDQGVDCYFSGLIDGRNQTVAVEVRVGRRPADIKCVQQAFALKNKSPNFDRAMVISRAGFLAETLREAESLGLGEIDLIGPAALRNWVRKQVIPEDVTASYERIVGGAMKSLADLVARYPQALAKLQWWEVEAVPREAFEGMGFGARKTRSSKDGGFDVELTISEGGKRRVFLVEVKHCADSGLKPAGIPINYRPPFRFEAGHYPINYRPVLGSNDTPWVSNFGIKPPGTRGEFDAGKEKADHETITTDAPACRKRNKQPRDRGGAGRCSQHGAG